MQSSHVVLLVQSVIRFIKVKHFMDSPFKEPVFRTLPDSGCLRVSTKPWCCSIGA